MANVVNNTDFLKTIYDAVGVPAENVTSITIKAGVNKIPEITMSFFMTEKQGNKITDAFKVYHFYEK